MKNVLQLTEKDRGNGSYLRMNYKTDVINSFFRYREINITFSKTNPPIRVNDGLTEQMLINGLITREDKDTYEKQIGRSFENIDLFDGYSLEALYLHIQRIRKQVLGIHALEKIREFKALQGVDFDPTGGIDQRQKKSELMCKSHAIIFVLFEAELYSLMEKDICEAKRLGKEIYVLVSRDEGDILPTKGELMRWQADCQWSDSGEYNIDRFLKATSDLSGDTFECIEGQSSLQHQVDLGKVCLFAYGEDGLLQCRSLKLDSIVSAIPSGYHVRAVTNQLSCRRACVVYVPSQLDITRWVRLTEKTRISFWQLAKLWEAYGDRIYGYSLEELYYRYPQHFLNIYDNLGECVEARPEYPIQIASPQKGGMAQFDQDREMAIKEYLNRMDNVQYYSACYDGPILVNAVRVKRAEKARVVQCEKSAELRKLFSTDELSGPAIVSNFLFFLTPKLASLYNDLRKDRPREQVDVQVGHLDYMLYEKDGKRIETFPLFRKACIALNKNGEFMFFNFRLGGGTIHVGDFTLSWSDTDVDVLTEDTADSACQAPVRIFTPYFSLPDGDEDRQTYRSIVGAGRINLVILQDRICCVRKGDVILPGFGVVVSLEESLGQTVIDGLGLPLLENGYYDAGGLEPIVELDAPSQITKEQWAQVKWAYGGGLSLILDGKGLCDGDLGQWFEEEGWMTPLSRQTQESALHKMEKHPRTAIGITQNGDLVIIVYSGRTNKSIGADYREMIGIARKMFPDIQTLMNVDGGGSAVLGMVVNGSFMELSYPSTSTDSCVGMTRPVNTVLYVDIK